MTSPATIVVAYASVGSGHRVVAEAVAAELSKHADAPRVELRDVLDYARPRISGNRLTTTFTGPTAGIYNAAWGSPAVGSIARAFSGPLYAAMFSGFLDALAEIDPDVVVCSHATPAVIAARAVQRGKACFKVVEVACDFGVHGYWPRNGVDLFCVADEPSAEALRGRGFEEPSIAVTGTPVRSQFTLDYECDAARAHFDLPPGKRLVLALAGSKMPGPYERFKQALAVALPAIASLPDTEVAVVAGKDAAFADAIRSRAAGFGTTNVHVFGFVKHMAPLMACADLALAKPGGSTCSECLAAGLPVVLVGPAVGQEAANAYALSEAGAAVYTRDPRLIAESTRKVISKPARLKAMRTAAEGMARPFAASDVAERVLGLVHGG